MNPESHRTKVNHFSHSTSACFECLRQPSISTYFSFDLESNNYEEDEEEPTEEVIDNDVEQHTDSPVPHVSIDTVAEANLGDADVCLKRDHTKISGMFQQEAASAPIDADSANDEPTTHNTLTRNSSEEQLAVSEHLANGRSWSCFLS